MPRDWPHPDDPPLSARSLRLARLTLVLVIVATLIAAASAFARRPARAAKPVPLRCRLVAIDGDTLRCGTERIRLLAIDAPEIPGHCRPGRRCAPGDPVAARRALTRLLHGPALIERHGRDRYGRTLAWVVVEQMDLSCAQLRRGFATYRADWAPDRRAARCVT